MVLIDMEMPKRCGECFNCDRNFNDGEKTIENWMCLLRMRFVGDYEDSGRPQWCPLKPFTPAADVVPVRHGRWRQNDNGTWSCSECSSWIPDEQHYYAKFCLHCGAKMDGGADK